MAPTLHVSVGCSVKKIAQFVTVQAVHNIEWQLIFMLLLQTHTKKTWHGLNEMSMTCLYIYCFNSLMHFVNDNIKKLEGIQNGQHYIWINVTSNAWRGRLRPHKLEC